MSKEKLNTELKNIRAQKHKIYTVFKLLNETSALFLDLSFQTEAVQLWQKDYPEFQTAIRDYVSDFDEEELKDNIKLQQFLGDFFNKGNSEENADKFFRRNPTLLEFFSASLPKLQEAGNAWSIAKKGYEDYVFNKDKKKSLETQISHGLNADNPNYEHFPKLRPFDFAKALEESEARVNDLYSGNHRLSAKQLLIRIQSEMHYLTKLEQYTDINFTNKQFEKEHREYNGSWELEEVRYTKTKQDLAKVRENLQALENTTKPKADAQHFVRVLRKVYSRA